MPGLSTVVYFSSALFLIRFPFSLSHEPPPPLPVFHRPRLQITFHITKPVPGLKQQGMRQTKSLFLWDLYIT